MPKPTAKKREPLWKGPEVDGITQSLLGKFLECRERFRLKVVEGLSEDEGFSRPLEFGNLWHAAEEANLGGKSWETAIKQYRLRLERNYPNDTTEIFKWYNVCKTTFPIYLKYWAKHKDEAKAKPVLEETSFAVPYLLPSGRKVLLRGKWDALRLLPIGKTKQLGIYIKEHKTKGEIDEEGILKTVAWNLQTMMYQIALRTLLDLCMKHLKDGIPVNEWPFYGVPIDKLLVMLSHYRKNVKPAGVHYNVIRRPLADRYAIKQRKFETNDQFFKRLGEIIQADGKNFFMRWMVEVIDQEIEDFKARTFHPILESLLDWWEWIRIAPFDPWSPRTYRQCAEYHKAQPNYKELTGKYKELVDAVIAERPTDQILNTRHFQSPWGVYNSLAGGFRGSFFQYLTTGRDYGLTKIKTLYPELT